MDFAHSTKAQGISEEMWDFMRSHLFPQSATEAITCQAPNTGNMEISELFATPEQRRC